MWIVVDIRKQFEKLFVKLEAKGTHIIPYSGKKESQCFFL